MLVLTNSTDSLTVVLGGAITTNQLKCFVSYVENTEERGYATNTNSATPVTLVSGPATSTYRRKVQYISVYNTDTVNASVTLSLVYLGTSYTLFLAALAPGEKIEYTPESGFKVFSNAGSIKGSINQGTNATTSSLQTVVLGADITNNNAIANTIQDVTNFGFAVTATKRYWFRFIIAYTSAATTTGSRWTINGPALTSLSYYSQYSLTTTSNTVNTGLAAYDLPAASNATSAATAANIAIVEGIITPSANGTVIARFASEVAGSAVIAKAGSVLYYQQLT